MLSPRKPFGAEQRGADVQMRQRKVETGCFVRDRRREEVVFIRLGDDGLGPVTAYRCPERLLIRLATGHYDKVGDVGKLQTPVHVSKCMKSSPPRMNMGLSEVCLFRHSVIRFHV